MLEAALRLTRQTEVALPGEVGYAIEAAISLARRDAERWRWVPCSERMPKPDQLVLASWIQEPEWTATARRSGAKWRDADGYEVNAPDYWMAITEPPETKP